MHALDPRLEQHRVELTGYCYRMLGSAFEAEDAVQETLVRAWRHFDRFDERRGSLRTWLYTIATNICLDMLRSAQRRARAMDLGPASAAGTQLGTALPAGAWVEPIHDGRVLPTEGDPAQLAVQRETIRLAFVAALQHLPPRQRAVLILREVLAWRAEEVARLLGTSTTAVNSALQRARSTLDARAPGLGTPEQLDKEDRTLLDRYVDAFERHDVAALTALLHEDATSSMPPFTWWLRGRDTIRRVMEASDACEGDRLLPTAANGSPAFGQYRSGAPFALVILETSAEFITGITTFLGSGPLFPRFDLPPTWSEAVG